MMRVFPLVCIFTPVALAIRRRFPAWTPKRALASWRSSKVIFSSNFPSWVSGSESSVVFQNLLTFNYIILSQRYQCLFQARPNVDPWTNREAVPFSLKGIWSEKPGQQREVSHYLACFPSTICSLLQGSKEVNRDGGTRLMRTKG